MEIVKTLPDKYGWYDLSPHWDWLVEISQKIHDQKDHFKSTRPWNKKAHFIGNCGEMAITLATGIMFDTTLRIEGQGDTPDFKDTEVKCSTYFTDPHLKHPIDETRWPKYFVLVSINERQKKVKIVGWATAEMLKAGSVINYGYGDQYTLDDLSLEPGLPPSFKI